MAHLPAPDDWREANRAMWDERVPIHLASGFYDLDAFRAGRDALCDFQADELGDVTGKSVLHLQCHIGLDTLSLARRGASQVVGLDFSAPAVEAARDLAAELGFGPDRACFVAADVYDAVEAVPDSAYDIVYTGVGALCWLPDIVRWAETVAALVAPGGFLYLSEFHPLVDALDEVTASRIAYDYFNREPWIDETPGTYADTTAPTSCNRRVEWQHPLGSVISALAAAGLRVEFLHEHDMTLFKRFDSLQPEAGTPYYRLPPDQPRVPLMYSLRASKPPAHH
ncbi:class I SAM-dependent methyltransferase [Streptomyces sp. 71268]|uniref:class I SAM-dependent methyltransferase n=1 Tax=Streptomyces sp. 71268 TaxID=3002640 RepID=UPI0023F7DEB5|nr:class I SAM-dependent methyltransferase [Streptomyces sp. 71268]WEV26785.1 class I SAM-dependent methyltransferase [Streptomyces sp. 71268]